MTRPQHDEEYVSEILASVPAGLNREAFRDACRFDINAGYTAEVDEAERRYFAGVSGQ